MKRILTVLGVLAGFVAVPPCEAESLPRSGTFTGYYRADRWGNHTFAGFPVEPNARGAFKEHQDQLVTADLQEISQPINPGAGFVAKVGKVTPIKDAAIEIKLAWADNPEEGQSPLYRRIRPGDTFKFKVTVTNKLQNAFSPATVRSDGFYFTGVGAANVPTEDVTWDAGTDLRGGRSPSKEWKESRLELEAGKSSTWTVTIKNAPAGEFEFHVYFVEYREGAPEYLRIESNALRLDVVDEHAKSAAGLELVLIPEANPPRPPRPIPAKLVFKNTNDKPLHIFLPYRKDKLAEDHVLRCFDPSGTMVLGARQAASADQVFGHRDIEQKQQRLGAGASLTFDVLLPDRTAFAAAQFRGTSLLDKSLRKPGELYFDTAGPATSGYIKIRR
jgi:hypothetical protein